MKNKATIAAFVIFCLVSFIMGCAGSVEGPGIYFGQDKYNFGTVEEGKIVNHVFEFFNNGNQTLVIDEVHPTCGCTVAGDYDKEIKPGKSGKIPLSFKSSGYDGKVLKTITVKTNVPTKKELTLNLEGNVKITISVNPRVVFLGNIERKRSAPLEGKISISNRLPTPIKLTSVEHSSKTVETKIETIKDGYEYSLDIKVNPPFKDGQVMETILVKTDNKTKSEINTQFSYYMEPLVRVYPNPLFVSQDSITQGAEMTINIQGQPEVNTQVTDLESNFANVKVASKEIVKGKQFAITVKFAKDFTFDQNKALTIKFKLKNIPGDSSFVVPIYKM